MYLDGELPAETLKERMELLAERYGDDVGLYGYNRDVLNDGDAPLNALEGEVWLMREIGDVKPDLIIFDFIMCLLTGSMAEEELVVKEMVRKISKRRIAQIWLHHTGHDTSKAFGTKTREWEMDTVIGMTKDTQNDEHIQMEFKKARLRTPKTREQFASLKIACDDGGWTIIGGGPEANLRKHPLWFQKGGRASRICAAYHQLTNDVDATPGLDGHASVRKVKVEAIRDLLKEARPSRCGGRWRRSYRQEGDDLPGCQTVAYRVRKGQSFIQDGNLIWMLYPTVHSPLDGRTR